MKTVEQSSKTTVQISRATRELVDRCARLMDALPEPQRSNARFVTALTGGMIPGADSKVPAGEVIHYALSILEANLDPEAKAVRQAAELAYEDYCRRIRDAHKTRPDPGADPNKVPLMGIEEGEIPAEGE